MVEFDLLYESGYVIIVKNDITDNIWYRHPTMPKFDYDSDAQLVLNSLRETQNV